MKPSKAKTRRLFIALWPDDETRAHLYECQQTILQNHNVQHPGRLVARNNLHLTLCFLGDLNELQFNQLCSQLGSIKQAAFELQLQSLGYFKHPRIAWLGLKAPAPVLSQFVMQLNEIVSSVLPEFCSQPGNFIAHVSLFKNAAAVTDDLVCDVIPWQVKDFVLAESVACAGEVQYKVLRHWPFV